jgi:hypothetical protein
MYAVENIWADVPKTPTDPKLEAIREQRRRAEAQLKLLAEQEQGLLQGAVSRDSKGMSLGLKRISLNGPVSEPTTPPEYADNAYPRRYSRSTRLSMTNISSPPGLGNRLSQSSVHITSPPSGQYGSNNIYSQTPKSPAKSMPVSRRGSDEEESYPEELPSMRSAAS